MQYLLKLSNFICDLQLFDKSELKANFNYKMYFKECAFAVLLTKIVALTNYSPSSALKLDIIEL